MVKLYISVTVDKTFIKCPDKPDKCHLFIRQRRTIFGFHQTMRI